MNPFNFDTDTEPRVVVTLDGRKETPDDLLTKNEAAIRRLGTLVAHIVMECRRVEATISFCEGAITIGDVHVDLLETESVLGPGTFATMLVPYSPDLELGVGYATFYVEFDDRGSIKPWAKRC